MILTPYAPCDAFSLIVWLFTKKIAFFAIIFLNMDNSVNIEPRLFKLCVLILNIMMKGTISQIFILGPSSYFMLFRK